MKRLSIAFAVHVLALSSGPLFATPCTSNLGILLAPDLKDFESSLTKLATEEPIFAPRLQTLALYKSLSDSHADMKTLLSEDEFMRIIGNPEATYAPEMLDLLLKSLSAETSGNSLAERVEIVLPKILEDKVPASTIKSRVENFLAHKGDDSLLRALGDMELAETQELYHGGNPLSPTADSLLGKYIKESGATTVVKSFPLFPGSTDLGPKRLVVSVSEASFASYQRYFKKHDSLSVIGHAYMIQNGKLSSYIHNGVDMRLPSPGNTLPTVILKTSEADRTTQFLRVLNIMQQKNGGGWQSPVMQPWKINDYCAVGAYANCTHWIGNMPIGDRHVDEYALPGAADAYAQNHIKLNDSAPRIAKLKDHKSDDVLLRRIFKTPGNEQFADVIGQRDANLNGNFANPGWVISTLLGPTSQERVPVVFLISTDHKLAIDPNFVPQYEQPL